MTVDLIKLSAREAARRIREGSLTAEALMRAYLERIAEKEAQVGAWQFIDPDLAIKCARERDRASVKGALHGLPIAVKDIIDTVDMPTEYGSPLYAGHRPDADASCVTLIRAAGGIVLGKTVSTEFAALAPGKTRNPHNLAHTPGGSSSGSAAALAADMVPLALGTQTSGSLIRPASFCGVVAYKPTRGTIDKTGVKPLADSLDTVGTMARNVRDVAFLASILSGRPDLSDDIGTPRIGLFRTPHWDVAKPETHDALAHVQRATQKAGAQIVEVTSPSGFIDLIHAHDVIMDREMLHALAFERLMRADRISPKTRAYLEAKKMPSSKSYDAAQAKAAAMRGLFDEIYQRCDILLTPASVGEAPLGLDSTGDPTFNRVWTLLGMPCVTVPTFREDHALPVGVQLVGRVGADLQTLAAAEFVEAVTENRQLSSSRH